MINVGVPINEHSDELLEAGYRSLLRAFDMLCKPYDKEIPDEFTLGKHHLRFFMDKGEYIINKINAVHNELNCRKLPLSGRRPDITLDHFEEHRRKNWYPTPEDYRKVKRKVFKKYGVELRYSYLENEDNYNSIVTKRRVAREEKKEREKSFKEF